MKNQPGARFQHGQRKTINGNGTFIVLLVLSEGAN